MGDFVSQVYKAWELSCKSDAYDTTLLIVFRNISLHFHRLWDLFDELLIFDITESLSQFGESFFFFSLDSIWHFSEDIVPSEHIEQEMEALIHPWEVDISLVHAEDNLSGLITKVLWDLFCGRNPGWVEIGDEMLFD